MQERKPVTDWATDYDIFDKHYVENPTEVWAELRDKCPIAHTERMEGSWLPTKFEDLQAFVGMVPALSSKDPIVVPPMDISDEERGADGGAPPITADPPQQNAYRRAILPFFTVKAVAKHRQFTEDLCHDLINRFHNTGKADAAADYAQQIPPRVIGHMLGIDPNRTDEFTQWVRNVLEFGLTDIDLRMKYRVVIRDFFFETVADRRKNMGDEDLISKLILSEVDGRKLDDNQIVSMCNLLLVAGIDTTWSSIGAALWHFAAHEDDRKRLSADHSLFPTAIEEMLRYYAPVTMARVATEDIEYKGVTIKEGDKVLMNFPGACHDPDMFEDADKVVIDRQKNRHIAFGAGIHRCAGSNLARMEMDVALRVWFERMPEFELSDPEKVTWAGGQVRGPRTVPVRF
ncbi:cytochrome P450 [Minwuia sp.]|uniref:cytochrome P450 n=1 Tax=Minwuia sp. TaxID=2493630 RepID=UPI003A8EB256